MTIRLFRKRCYTKQQDSVVPPPVSAQNSPIYERVLHGTLDLCGTHQGFVSKKSSLQAGTTNNIGFVRYLLLPALISMTIRLFRTGYSTKHLIRAVPTKVSDQRSPFCKQVLHKIQGLCGTAPLSLLLGAAVQIRLLRHGVDGGCGVQGRENVKPGGEGVRPTTWLAIYSPHSMVCSATYEDGEAVLTAALGVVTALLHPDHGHRLLLDVVERVGLELDFLEVDVHEVDATDVAVPCCPVV